MANNVCSVLIPALPGEMKMPSKGFELVLKIKQQNTLLVYVFQNDTYVRAFSDSRPLFILYCQIKVWLGLGTNLVKSRFWFKYG